MLLIVNTTPQDHLEIIIANKRDGFKVKKVLGRYNQAEKLMPAIDKFFGAQKIKLEKFRGIGVVSGPGGFTAVRIGVAVANALAFASSLPVAAIKADEFKNNDELVAKLWEKIRRTPSGKIVMPYYDREPNITKPRIKN